MKKPTAKDIIRLAGDIFHQQRVWVRVDYEIDHPRYGRCGCAWWAVNEAQARLGIEEVTGRRWYVPLHKAARKLGFSGGFIDANDWRAKRKKDVERIFEEAGK